MRSRIRYPGPTVMRIMGHRLEKAAQERLLPAMTGLFSRKHPPAARRLPLAIAIPALVLLILVVVLVAAMTRDAAWTAGTAAVATMVVLAYQGWQIQESTAVSAQAVVVGQAAAIEAEKRRLDVKAPRIRVRMDPPDWPPSGPRLYVGSDPGHVPAGHIYRCPKNERDHVSLWVQGEVLNEGVQTVDVELSGVRLFVELPGAPTDTPGRSPWSEPDTYRMSVAPGDTIRFRLQGEAMVKEWVENYMVREANRGKKGTWDDPVKPLPTGIDGKVSADDGDDNGVIDTWALSLTGWPLEPVPGEAESWRIPSVLPEQIPVKAGAGLRRRTYWRSKERGLELAAPEG